jgi:hypothetical protein
MSGPWEDYAPTQTPSAPKPKVKPAARPLTEKQRRESLDALRNSDAILNRELKGMTPAERKKALSIYYADPRIKKLRQEADLVPLASRDDEIKRVARRRVAKEAPPTIIKPNTISRTISMLPGGRLAQTILGTEQGQALSAGAEKGAFNLPVRARSAINYIAGLLGGEGRSYEDEFAISTEENRLKRERAPVTALLGEIGGGFASGGGAAKGITMLGSAVARQAPRAGNAIASLTRLEKGRRASNAAKIVGAGAGGGAAQALGEGEDVVEGAAIGAVAAPAVVGGVKLAEWMIARPARDLLRLTTGKTWLRRTVSEPPEAIAARAEKFRRDTGTEPTLFEVLNAEDRQSVQGLLRKLPGSSREQASEAVRSRVGNMPRELSERTAAITAPQQMQAARQIALDLAEARGTVGRPTREELALAQRAVRDPTELEMVRRTISRSIMKPFDDLPAYETLDEIMPTQQVLDGSTVRDEISDPEVAQLIRSAAGARRMSPDGLTIRDVSDILSDLRSDIGRGGIEGRAAQRAVNHLEDVIARDYPDAATAMQRMVDAHAARSRMLEGVSEGRATRVRENIPVTGAKQARTVRNVYDTAEGSTGRAIGQRAEIMDDFGGTPNQAVARAGEIADAPLVREAIGRNLGDQAGRDIAAMSSAQAESLRRLGALRRNVQGENNETDAGDIIVATALLSPTSLLRTKALAGEMIVRALSGIPEGRANALVDMLFSQDRRMVARGLNLLESAGQRGQAAVQEIAAAIAVGAQGADVINANNSAPSEASVSAEGEVIEEEGPWNEFAVEGVEVAQPDYDHYGRAVIEGLFPEAVITEDFRDADSDLGRANPDSFHVNSDGAVDIRPIPGMTFEEFIQRIEDAGYVIIEAMNETGGNKSGHATGDHWHVVFE